MLKVLIVEDNIFQNKQITNYISQKNENLKVYYIAYTYKEAISIIKKEIVDIIILDLNLPDISGVEIIKFIENNKLSKYINSILVISSADHLFSKICKSQYVFSIINKPYSLHNIQENLNWISEHIEEEKIMNKIYKELQFLHYNMSYNGTRYLADTIYELFQNDINLNDNLKKNIYPLVANKYRKSVNTICGNIKQATKCMYLDCDEKIIMQYFNCTNLYYPKLKEIIFTILHKIS